jgi:hypothetical protein
MKEKLLPILQEYFTGAWLCDDSCVQEITYDRYTAGGKRYWGYRFEINDTRRLTDIHLETFVQRIHAYFNIANIYVFSECGGVKWYYEEY